MTCYEGLTSGTNIIWFVFRNKNPHPQPCHRPRLLKLGEMKTLYWLFEIFPDSSLSISDYKELLDPALTLGVGTKGRFHVLAEAWTKQSVAARTERQTLLMNGAWTIECG